MMKINMILSCMLLWLVSACTSQEVVEITVSPEVTNAGYIGNGAEWDPYDEAEAWGASISDKDWETLCKRLDFMKPQYIRCMINSPYRYYDSETGTYDKTRNIASISRLLRYCTERGITVMYGEYNPPTWDMKQDQKWVDMSVDYLNYLVNDLGFSCIKYFVNKRHWMLTPLSDCTMSMLIRVRMKCVPDNILKFFPAINVMFPRGKRLFWVRPVISIGVMLILC